MSKRKLKIACMLSYLFRVMVRKKKEKKNTYIYIYKCMSYYDYFFMVLNNEKKKYLCIY